jgi:ribonuclease PH
MRPPPRLSNCYIPQSRHSSATTLNDKAEASTRSLDQKKRQIVSHRTLILEQGEDSSTTSLHRSNSRRAHELRPLRMESNVIQSSSSSSSSLYSTPTVSGSALVELGHTKVLCTVIGPVTSHCSAVPSSMLLSLDRGTIHVDVSYMAHSSYPMRHIPMTQTMDATSTGTTTTTTSSSQSQQQQAPKITTKQCSKFIQDREYDLSARITTALSSAIPMMQYPKCAFLLQFTILYDDGSVLPVCISAATLALINANIELYDVVTSCTVAIVSIPPSIITTTQRTTVSDQHDMELDHPNDTTTKENGIHVLLLADPTLDELSIADSIITIATMPNWEEQITLWEQQSLVAPLSSNRSTITNRTTDNAIELCLDGCRTMHQFIRQHVSSSTTTL